MEISSKVYGKRGDVAYWWFWDGESLRYDPAPGPEVNSLPLREVVTSEALLARLGDEGAFGPPPSS